MELLAKVRKPCNRHTGAGINSELIPRRVGRYSSIVKMRRAFSISIIVALVCAMFSPAFAATCESMGKKSVGDRAKGVVNHCDMMGHHHETAATPETTAFVAGVGAPKCPMSCCDGAYFITAIASHVRFVSPAQLVMNHEFRFSAVVFVSPGFSSHTDRGPPLV